MARQQKRVTRKELKEDPLMTALSEARSWWEINGTKSTIGIVVLVVVIIGVIFSGKMKESAEAEASAALMEITQSAGNQTIEALVGPLEELTTNYAGTRAGSEALFALGQLAMQNGDYESAVEHFSRFTTEYKKQHLTASAAMMGQATALENLGRFEEAAAVYDRLLTHKDSKYAKPFVLFAAGRSWELAGDLEKALERYQMVDKTDAEDQIKERAKLEIAKLEAAR